MYDMLTIGDIKLDVFISLDRCSDKCDLQRNKVCFDFGEKISVDLQDQQVAGSAPNVAVALTRLGKKTAVLSNMGQDQTQKLAIEFLQKEGVETTYIKTYKGIASAYSAVLNLQGEKTILTAYVLESYHLPKQVKTKWFYLSEMGNGYEKLYKELVRRIKRDKTHLGFNPGNQQIRELKPELYDLIKDTTVLFVNVEEGQRIIKNRRVGIKTLAERLYKLGPEEVIITDGRNGAYGYDGTNLYKIPIFPGPRIEATGAGDSFASAYLGAKMHGLSMAEGLRWGTVNSAEVVLHIGPTRGLLTHRQIELRLKKNPKHQAQVI